MKRIIDSIRRADLPGIVQGVIEKGLTAVLQLGVEPISIIVFGSSLRADFVEKTSDVDWILVVDDSLCDDLIDEARVLLQKVNPREKDLEGFLGPVLRMVGLQTGMYVSGFVARRSDIVNLRFQKIFNISKLTGKLLAPGSLVLGSVFSNAETIYGDELIPSETEIEYTFTQILKSISMNLLLSVSALLIAPLTQSAMRFTTESIKWSIYAKHFYRYGNSLTIHESIRNLELDTRFPALVRRFKKARESFSMDPILALLAPFYVLRIHLG